MTVLYARIQRHVGVIEGCAEPVTWRRIIRKALVTAVPTEARSKVVAILSICMRWFMYQGYKCRRGKAIPTEANGIK